MRVHELAKELGLTSKDLLARLKERKIEAKGHMANLDEDVVKLFLEERQARTGQPVAVAGKKLDSASTAVKTRRPAGRKEKPEAAKKPAAAPAETAPSASTQPALAKKEEGAGPGPETARPAAPAAPAGAEVAAPAEAGLKPLEVDVPINVKDLAEKLGMRTSDLIKFLMLKLKLLANINQSLSQEIVAEVLKVHGYELVIPEKPEEVVHKVKKAGKGEQWKGRSPIVTFMGHVDHGKTSLLDMIRRTKVAESEHGGITQHIGAYEVKLPKGRITFLDTPGHEAFTAMRARGANATDIVVLVVAADDGIMPQTIEAYDHAKAAGVPIVVAMNKIDKPQANVDRLKKQLGSIGLLPEDWGGKTITVGVSAKTGEGIDRLLEMILLEAEMLELKASYEVEASGVVIEAKMSKGRGPVATILVQQGVLKDGDFVIAGYQSGRVRAMFNDLRQPIEEALPSQPVEINGLTAVPEAGDHFYVVRDEKKAREIVEQKQEELRRQRLEPMHKNHLRLEDLHKEIKAGSIKQLNIILKADVQGSLEAIEDSLNKIGSSEVQISVMHKGVGPINSSDVILAAASNAIIIGFHVEADDQAKELAQKEGIDIRTYRVIYEIFNDMKAALEGMLAPKIKKNFIGRAEVRKVFHLTKYGIVAGSFVKKGKIARSAQAAVVRNGEVVHEGKIAAVKRFKDDVREVAEGFECGISLVGFEDIKEGDFIDAFEIEHVARKLA
ncbi:MAG: translation initiation factor IF-2 [Candidatus Omnitrophica bacterium]|nr:translation initiation factor IF-2 [Candidatus Omnitrophota bacterium]